MASNYINLGEGRWRKRWISKQDLVEYLRCSYRVYLSLSKGIPIKDMKETALLKLILEKGLEFESEVVQDIKPREVQSEKAIESLKKESLLIQVPKIFRNHDLGIQGIPDLINTDKGRFLPIEVKNHKAVTDIDELELAFYWLLLNPLRGKKVKPRGYIILNTEEVIEVNLTKDHLWEVEFRLGDIRELEKMGAQPCLSQECKQCKLEKDCREEVVRSGSLSIIYNISHTRERQLRDIGINNISELMLIDEHAVNSELISRFKNTPGVDEIFRMKCHAFSIKSGKPFFFGDIGLLNNLISSSLLVLDLEYDPEYLIWLVGIAVKTKNHITYHQFFAEKANLDEERRILDSLVEMKLRYPNHSFITYGGISADMPQLQKACYRQGYSPHKLSTLLKNHVDLCQFLRTSFRLPIASFGLDDAEEYLGIMRDSNIANGLEALGQYKRYLRTRDNKLKLELKRELLDYNREDISSTLSIIQRMRFLVGESLRI